MKNFKKVLALVLSVVMMLGTFTMTFAADKTGNEKVDKLVELELVKGDARGYRLAEPISRAETTVMLVRAKDAEEAAVRMADIPSQFPDVANHWAKGYVNFATGDGLIKGDTAGTFRPDANITYAEVAAMLIRVLDGMTADEVKTAVWPYTYITKATELGIFAGVTGVDYNATAQREKVFEMVYNALTHKDANLLIANTIEGIVIENYRTERLDEDKVVIHVMKDQVQRTGSKYFEKDDEYTATITDDLKEKGIDVETLLGKVVTVSLDKNDEIIDIKIDENYDYLQGSLNEADTKQIKLNGKWYTVAKDEGRNVGIDERLYQVYLNNEDLHYEGRNSFVEKTEKADGAEYARITVRNGKVLFIDAFAFEDIAPVAKDINSKDVVTYYDDTKDGALNDLKVTKDAYVVVFEEEEMKLGNYEDISAEDVIHWYTDGRKNLTVFVRPASDNVVEGEYKDVSAGKARDDAKVYIKVDSTEYPADLDEEYNRNPVYSYLQDEYEFRTLTGRYDSELAAFEKKDVTLLLDMFGKVQSIATDTKDGSYYAIITDTSRSHGEIKLVTADNEQEWYATDRNTKYNTSGNTQDKKFDAFEKNDLVKVNSVEGVISKLDKLGDDSDAGNVDAITKDFIEIDGDKYYIGRRTPVFVTGKPAAMTMAEFLDKYKVKFADGDVVEGYAYVADSSQPEERRVADAIVITKATAKDGDRQTLVRKVVDVRISGSNYSITVEDVDGNKKTHKVDGDTAKQLLTDKDVVKGSIVELKVTKDDDQVIKSMVELIDENEAVYKIDKLVDGVRRGENWITIGTEVYWAGRDASVFGDYKVGSWIAFTTDTNNSEIIKVIDVRKEPTTPSLPTGVVVYKGKYTLDGNDYVQLGNDSYPYVGPEIEFNVNDKVKATFTTIRGEKVVTSITLAP